MASKTTYFYPQTSLNLGGLLLNLSTPKVMGILNLSPDSFFDGGKYSHLDNAIMQAEKMKHEGASIIDIGGMSTRPGVELIETDEELKRVIPIITEISKRNILPISIDTVKAKVAYEAIQHGAVMINDISSAKYDVEILTCAAKFKVPYILMHMQNDPQTMQNNPIYNDVVKEVFEFFLLQCQKLVEIGITSIILDPGFGFGKTVGHNFQLAKNLEIFSQIGFPVMVGISRKSMICKLLHINPEKALNGSTALHAALLLKDASLLRVHDVKEAVETLEIITALKNA